MPRTRSLPLDLLRNVLSRLPVKSLLKFRSVCREWRDIIDDPHLAAKQAASGAESARILLLPEPSSSGVEPRFAVDKQFLETSLLNFAVTCWPYVTRACRHGLLYFEEQRSGATYLLNPLTRETVSLPSVDAFHEGWCLHSAGIGVNRLTSRLKILRVSSSLDSTVLTLRAEVLDQGSQSWRDTASAPSQVLLEPVFAAGSMHWNASAVNGGPFRIYSFDMVKEEFSWTACPALEDARLVDLQGVLGLVDCTRRKGMDVWVMEEGGRWMKKHSVQLIPPMLTTCYHYLNVLSCGGRKIAVYYADSFCFYDLATKKLRHVRRDRVWRVGEVGSITVSLLSPAKLWNSGVAEISAD